MMNPVWHVCDVMWRLLSKNKLLYSEEERLVWRGIPPEDQWVQITKKGLHFYKWVNLGFTFHGQLFLPNLFGSVTNLYYSHSKYRQYLGFLSLFLFCFVFLTEVIGKCQVIKVDDKGEGDNPGSLQNWRTLLRSWGNKTIVEFGRKMIESGNWASNSQRTRDSCPESSYIFYRKFH